MTERGNGENCCRNDGIKVNLCNKSSDKQVDWYEEFQQRANNSAAQMQLYVEIWDTEAPPDLVPRNKKVSICRDENETPQNKMKCSSLPLQLHKELSQFFCYLAFHLFTKHLLISLNRQVTTRLAGPRCRP